MGLAAQLLRWATQDGNAMPFQADLLLVDAPGQQIARRRWQSYLL